MSEARILLADDDEELCQLLRDFLARDGFTVDVSHDGDEALARARDGGYDALILDVMLPGRSGLDLLRELRREDTLPVLMLTALGELLVSGLGLAMIARYVPARMGGFMMGAYYVGVGISQYLGGLVANFAAVPQNVTDPMQTLPIYTSLFTKLGWAGVACTAIAIVVIWPMKHLSRAHAAHVSDDPSGVPTVAAER